MLIGLLKYLHKGPKVFKEKEEKPFDELFKMPTRKEIEEKAKQLLKRHFKVEDEEIEQVDEDDDENTDAESQIMKAMKNAPTQDLASTESDLVRRVWWRASFKVKGFTKIK